MLFAKFSKQGALFKLHVCEPEDTSDCRGGQPILSVEVGLSTAANELVKFVGETKDIVQNVYTGMFTE